MLDVKKNRLDYGEQLIPPDGSYDLDYAVGTTYSLDLEAIMVLPVALFYSRLLDCSPDDLHFDVLDAITRATDKIRVYCQKGKIKVPKKYNHLMAYWEKGISQIRMDYHAASFHPKVWVVRFTARDKKPYYRLLITSRNLTYTHDWDAAFSTEGDVGNQPVEKNKPLLNFLQYLERNDEKKLPRKFLEDLSMVNFNLPDGFHLMNFYPIGFESQDSRAVYPNPLGKNNWDDLLCISPFVDDKSLKFLAEKSGKKITVLSRKDELDGVSEALIKDVGENRFYQFSELIQDAEWMEGLADGSRLEIMLQNLHAKIFIGSKSAYQHWFIGSANCTQPAFGRNIEFMVELKSNQNKLSPVKIRNMLTQEVKNAELPPFEKYQLKNRKNNSERKSLENKLRKLIYDITGLAFEGMVIPRSMGTDNLWDIIIKCDARDLIIPPDFKVMIKPLPEADRLPKNFESGVINEISDFKGYGDVQLSPYLNVSIQHNNETIRSFITEMTIALPDSRLNSIFKTIIDSRDKFMKYIVFLLNGSTPEPVVTRPNSGCPGIINNGRPNSLLTSSLYENLMVAVSRKPERIKAIEKIIERLKEQKADNASIVSDDFQKLWKIFQGYIHGNTK